MGVRVLEKLGLSDEIPIAALAKSFEEVFRPGSPDPVRIARGSDALFLLQRVRDEAHRFAIGYHRNLRGKRMTREHPRRSTRTRAVEESPAASRSSAASPAPGERLSKSSWL